MANSEQDKSVNNRVPMTPEEFIRSQQISNDKRFQHLDTELGEVKQEVSTLRAGMGSLSSRFSSFQNEIGRRFDQVLDYVRENKPKQTNLISIGSLVIALGVAMGGYLQIRLTPTESSVDRLIQLRWEEAQHEGSLRESIGEHEQRITENEKELERLWDLRHKEMPEIGNMQGRLVYIEDILKSLTSDSKKYNEALGELEALKREIQDLD